MKTRWLAPFGVLLIMTMLASAQSGHGPITQVGYLAAVAMPSLNSQPRPSPYEPQPGDIVLYDNFNKLYHLAFKIAKTAPPTHAALVVARPDGTPALLELTGPRMITAKVSIIDVEARLNSYPGVIMVRRLREPLTPEQSHDLTKFAQAETGKSFAFGRVLLQGTPFSPRTGLGRELFGKTHLTRNRWFCSEMVVAGCATARLVDPKTHFANATYPRDLAYDETLDLSPLYHPPVYWTATASR
jgi:hypothetical protein